MIFGNVRLRFADERSIRRLPIPCPAGILARTLLSYSQRLKSFQHPLRFSDRIHSLFDHD
jgi:hypothetical protein